MWTLGPYFWCPGFLIGTFFMRKKYSVPSPYLYPRMISRGSTLDEVWLSTLGLRALSLSLMSQWFFLYPCSINPPPGGLYRGPLFLHLLLLLHLLLHLRRLSNDAGMTLCWGDGGLVGCEVYRAWVLWDGSTLVVWGLRLWTEVYISQTNSGDAMRSWIQDLVLVRTKGPIWSWKSSDFASKSRKCLETRCAMLFVLYCSRQFMERRTLKHLLAFPMWGGNSSEWWRSFTGCFFNWHPPKNTV